MKKFFTIIFLGFFSTVQGQKIEKYYDYNSKECCLECARFYSVRIKTDSGWHREDYYIPTLTLQLKGTYEDSSLKIPNGHFVYAYYNRQIKQIGKYIHGKKEGVWLGYYSSGFILDSTYYEQGKPIGHSLSWHDNGYLRDSTAYDTDGDSTKVTYFDNGLVSSTGRYNAQGKETGLWQYYHRNGKIAAREVYDNGKLEDRVYFNTEGIPQKDTINRDVGASLPGGWLGFKKFLWANLVYPHQYVITNTNQVTLLVLISIDESGVLKIEDHLIPFKPPFDNEIDRVLKKSPLWMPAISHNRTVKSYFKVPITFLNAKKG